MKAEILSTGDEISKGAVVDSNSAYIAEKLEDAGVEVTRHNCVGDDLENLVSILREIGSRSDIAIVTGGLGPTTDDLSSMAAAKAAGVELLLNDTAFQSMKKFFENMKGGIGTKSDQKQALLPEGSECLINPVGTAPGFVLNINKCKTFFLPGVPHEMMRMLGDQVLPRIDKLLGNEIVFNKTRILSVFGLAESAVSEYLENINEIFSDIKIGLRARFPEINIKLYVRGNDEHGLNMLLDNAQGWILEKIGKWVFSVEEKSMEEELGKILAEKKATLAVAESCTGGLISNMITNVAGSSDYFLFSGVTYTNQSKIDILGVSPETIRDCGAVHEQTVKEMAQGAIKISGATYGIATSGIAGPGGGTDEKPVGTLCIGIATPIEVKTFTFNLNFGKRVMNKTIFAMIALELLRKELLGIPA
ncbi:MAG: CinA family nicotinamide mononucleotide deamidase-related protein [Desulfobacterales bacterium]|nr:CinA family nicotinamide mononucleotide deamidase-related protein [Desulfobacterales bacterium]